MSHHRSIATIQGRPLGIRDEAFDLQLPTVDEVQVYAAGSCKHVFSPSISPMAGAAFAIHQFKLDPIMSEIKLLFYHLPSRVSAYVWPSDHKSSQASICQKLEEWRNALHEIAGSSQHDDGGKLEEGRNKLKLETQYYAAMVLLHQPSQAIPHPSDRSILTCYECAVERLHIYHRLYQLESYFQSWRSVQGIFSSGATMIYCLWSSSLIRRTIPNAVAMRDIRTCTNLLSIGGEFWPSVKKGKESFSRAIDALARKIDLLQRQHQQDSQNGSRAKHRRNGADVVGDRHADSPPNQIFGAYHAHTMPRSQQDLLDVPRKPLTTTDTDWSALGDNIFSYDDPSHSDAVFGTMDEAPDATMEAFIAEFLNDDTTWNPF